MSSNEKNVLVLVYKKHRIFVEYVPDSNKFSLKEINEREFIGDEIEMILKDQYYEYDKNCKGVIYGSDLYFYNTSSFLCLGKIIDSILINVDGKWFLTPKNGLAYNLYFEILDAIKKE